MTFNVTGANSDRLVIDSANATGAQLADSTNTFVLNPTTANLTFAANLGVLDGKTSSVLSLSGTSSNNIFSGVISGAGSSVSVTKTNTSTWTLTGTNTYTGLTTVSNGKLVVNGSISSSAITVQSGATLGGMGTVGALTVESGGTISPGNSPGILTVNGNYNQAGTLSAELNGTAVGTQYDQVNVTGTVTLSGLLALTVGGGYTPANGDMLFLVVKDGTDAINGNFVGLAQGAEFIQGEQKWSIHYNADSTTSSFTGGNDVALMAIPEPRAALLGGLGMLALLRRRRQ
jgi:autotransporter-associated beta strand protein